jgi:hypothetical protein
MKMRRGAPLLLLAAASASLLGGPTADAANENPVIKPVPPMARTNYRYGRANSCPSHKYRSQVFAYSCYKIKSSGEIHINTQFSNSARPVLNALSARYQFLDARKNIITQESLCYEFHTDPVIINRTREKVEEEDWKITPEQVSRIAFVRIDWFNDVECS